MKPTAFCIIVFLSVMTFLSPNISNKDVNTYQPAYTAELLQSKLAPENNTAPYYDLSWKERVEFEKSVWGFDMRDMLILGILFGVFIGSLKMAASYSKNNPQKIK